MTRALPRCGLIARADSGGLASQTFDFYTHMRPHKTMVVDIEHLTGYPNDFTKYPGAQIVKGFEPTLNELDLFLRDIDVVFTVECPYNYALFSMARERGIKTVLQYNYEWLENLAQQQLPEPDLFLAPSKWHINDMPFAPVEYMHVPIDRQKFPFKQRTIAKKFLHIAGHRTHEDRNGTSLLLEALPYIQGDVEIVIRTQDDLPRPYTDHRLTIIKEDLSDNKGLFNDEDVLILPRRYGGLSLQLNEALSCGMPVLMTDIEPQNEFLPHEWLMPYATVGQIMIKTNVQVYNTTPQILANKISEVAGRNITGWSRQADEIASRRDWRVMHSKYEEMFCSLVS